MLSKTSSADSLYVAAVPLVGMMERLEVVSQPWGVRQPHGRLKYKNTDKSILDASCGLIRSPAGGRLGLLERVEARRLLGVAARPALC